MSTYTIASCGHPVAAIGAPGSQARRAVESRTCDRARCRSDLPDKFSEGECHAWVWLKDAQITGWMVDLLTKKVHTADAEYPNLVVFADKMGWE